MCGIYCSIIKKSSECGNIHNNNGDSSKNTNYSKKLLENRGPNGNASATIQINNNSELELNMFATVLWQQGSEIFIQPVINDSICLLFNGDIYDDEWNDPINNGDCNLSDTEWLSKELTKICNSDNQDDDDLTITFLTKLKGPYSMILFNRHTNNLYFMRDSLGRQSLLISTGSADPPLNNNNIKDDNSSILTLTSVTERNLQMGNFIELPALGIFKYNINDLLLSKVNIQHQNQCIKLHLYPWQDVHAHEFLQEQIKLLKTYLETQSSSASSITIESNPLNPLWLCKENTNNGNSVRSYNFKEILHDEFVKCSASEIFNKLLENENISETCSLVIQSLMKSIEMRIKKTPPYCKNCIITNSRLKINCKHTKIGILYSGGIDCTILAALADNYIPLDEPIDLINVAFEKFKRTNTKPNELETTEIDFNTPDRISARESLKELIALKPKRQWNLIEINVSRAKLLEAQKNKITHLIYPLNTILDESIGSALWFAASGHGLCNNETIYDSPCRVLLSGIGADELFGGYTRHRNAFRREPNTTAAHNIYNDLENELYLDWIRLPYRNLGRDDRIIGDFGITLRTPFIEEQFSHLIMNLEPLQKCYHECEQGVGDKLLLRLCGYKMGLRNVCALKKRALQFGSRIANSKENAKNISEISKYYNKCVSDICSTIN